MLCEWLSSRLSRSASRAVRQLGYADELAALAARHRRCALPWQPHLEATRRVLQEQGKRHGCGEGHALILGAGLLADIPWEDLAGHYAGLRLVDAAFPPATRLLAARQRDRLQPVLHDLTGIIDRLGCVGVDAQPCDRLPGRLLQGVSWIASVNCLSQLPLAPAAWLLQRGVCEDAVESLGRAIITAHLRQLETAGCPCCLIAERDDRRFGRDGHSIGRTDYGPLLDPWLRATGAKLLAEWDWQVHPPGELADGETETRRVAAWALATP